jgi:hypothetical protein
VAEGEKLSTVGQPTDRHRRHTNRTTSVTVADLLAKSTPAEQASISEIQARAAAEVGLRTPPHGRPAAPVGARPPVGAGPAVSAGPAVGAGPAVDRLPAVIPQPEAATEPIRMDELANAIEDGTSRLAKTITATVVVMIGCGVVAAVTALGGERPDRLGPSTPVMQPVLMTGAAVIRPDAMIEQLNGGTVRRVPATPRAGAVLSRPGVLADRESAARVVRSFYAALPLRTKEAFSWLGPSMQLNAWKPFEHAWANTRSVEMSVLAPDPSDGELLRVTVSVEQFDGSLLRLLLRVEVRNVMVDGIAQLRIVGVQLLSAHKA